MSTRHFADIRDNSSARTRFALDFSFIYLCLLTLLCAVYVWQPLQGGEDFWAHAAVGRWICENGRVPTETLWLWSTPPRPWVAHSWLSEVLLYLLMRSGGVHLVFLFTMIFIALPFVWAWRLWSVRGGNIIFGALFFCLTISCASARFQPRPEFFTYFFLSVLLLFLIQNFSSATLPLETQPPVRKLLDVRSWGIVAMFALWANCHGAVVFGLVILLITWVCEVAQRRSLRAGWPLLRLTLLCAAAININPYGLRYWLALRQVGGDMFSMIDEWKSPLATPALPPVAIVLVLVVVGIAALAWVRSYSLGRAVLQGDAAQIPQARWAHLAWLLFFTFLFFSARRNLWPMMLVAVLVASANAQSLRTTILLPSLSITNPLRICVRASVGVLLLAWIISSLPPELLARNSNGTTLRAVSRFAPEGVAQYVLTQNPPDPIFNDYLRSNYFSWRFGGRRKLYIDVHNAYPAQLLRDYFNIVGRTPEGVERFEKLGINTVIFGRWDKQVGRLAPMAKYLSESPDWQQEYSGVDGAVWVRKPRRLDPQLPSQALTSKRVDNISGDRAR